MILCYLYNILFDNLLLIIYYLCNILYGRAKIHKPIEDGVPPFRPILLDVGTPTYKLAKFFVPLLAPLTSN